MWVVLGGLLATGLYLVSLLFAINAAANSRTPQGAVGWVVFLLATPFLAVPAYLFLGHHRFKGYLIARRETEQVVEAIRDFATDTAPDAGKVKANLAPFEYAACLPAARGNGADLLIDGQATFDAVFDEIDQARDYLLVQSYIIHDDDLGRALQDRLIGAVQRGLQVRLMTDAVGSFRLPADYGETLRDAGVEVVDKTTKGGGRFRFQLNYRNHRKTIIADGRVGFTGGLNIGDEYLGRNPHFGHWRDTHVRLRGPMVSQLQLIFAEDWHFAAGQELIIDDLNWQPPRATDDMTGLIVATGPGDRTETGAQMFFAAITEARESIWLASPYFVPDIDIVAALRNAALRGVDVRILVPDVIDHRMPWLAAFAYFDDIREAGVRVFRYTEGFMHQKVFVVDDRLAAVGTTNLDNRSFRLNFESMALFFDDAFAADVRAMLQDDFGNAFELTRDLAEQPRHIRYGAPVARLFSPLL